MHVMVAASELTAEPAKVNAQQRAEQAIAHRPFLRAFPGVFVVTIVEEGERAQLNKELGDAISTADAKAVILISPAMSAVNGAYLGRLTPTLWPEINKKIAL